jgi:hypothetical protein
MLGEERGGDDRECGILVASGFDGAGKTMPAFDDVLNRGHVG